MFMYIDRSTTVPTISVNSQADNWEMAIFFSFYNIHIIKLEGYIFFGGGGETRQT